MTKSTTRLFLAFLEIFLALCLGIAIASLGLGSVAWIFGGSGFIAATIAMMITSWDWLTCMLVTAPGGSTEMILVALALDHNPEIVTVAHSVRLMALNLSLPLWLFLFRYWEKQTVSH
jgi:hypothetical protein